MRHSAAIFGTLALVFVLSGAGESAPAATPVAAAVSSAPSAEPGPAAAPDTGADAVASAVESALDALAPVVVESSHPDALRAAFRAYFSYRAAHEDRVRKPYLYFVDYGLGNTTPRGYVFDMDALTLIEGPFTVAHGRGSSRGRNGVPTRFSNRPGSAATSLGLYLTQETYGFVGHAGGRTYRSVGLRLAGLSGEFNDAARARRRRARRTLHERTRRGSERGLPRARGAPRAAAPAHDRQRLPRLPVLAQRSRLGGAGSVGESLEPGRRTSKELLTL